MRRDDFFCLSLRRLVQPSTAALIMVTLTGSARSRQEIPITFPSLDLRFRTTSRPGSLVGFDVGIINGNGVFCGFTRAYDDLSGLIITSELSSLAVLGSGLIGLAGMGETQAEAREEGYVFKAVSVSLPSLLV